MKISESVLLFVAGVVVMFFASYIFPYETDPQIVFCAIMFMAGGIASLIGGSMIIFKVIENT